MENTEDKLICLRISTQGKSAEKKVSETFLNEDLFDVCYAYRSRVKSDKSIFDKWMRKKKDKPDYTITDITDILGFRFVTLFREDTLDVVKKVIEVLFHKSDRSPNPFVKGSLEEAIIYSNHSKYDEIDIQVKHYISEFGQITPEIKESQEGYSSIHLLARLEISVEDISGYQIPIEIQIRTVFEDAWGEIDHLLGYERRRLSNNKNGSEIDSHLKVLKRFTDACSLYADAILIDSKASEPPQHNKISPVDADNAAISILEEYGVGKDIIIKFSQARSMRKQAESEQNSRMFQDAAELFHTIYVNNKDKYNNEEASKTLRYYLQMDEALCLLSAATRTSIGIATEIYSNLLESYQGFPLIYFRLGQAYDKAGNIELAIESYDLAWKLIDELSPINETERLLKLPDHDLKFIQSKIAKLYGYLLWEKSQYQSNSEQTVVDLLVQAYEKTKLGFQVPHRDIESDVYSHNNMLYYLIEYKKKCKEFGLDSDEISDNDIEEHIKCIEDSKKTSELEDIELLDSLIFAYDFKHESDRAEVLAKKVMHFLFNKKVRTSSENVMLQRAYFILSKQGLL